MELGLKAKNCSIDKFLYTKRVGKDNILEIMIKVS